MDCNCPHPAEMGGSLVPDVACRGNGYKGRRWILGHHVPQHLLVRYVPYSTNRPSTNLMRQSGVVDNRICLTTAWNVIEQDFSALFMPS